MKVDTVYLACILAVAMPAATMAPAEYLNCNNHPTDALGFEDGQFSVEWFLNMYRKSALGGPFHNRCVFYTRIENKDQSKATPNLAWTFCDQENDKYSQSMSCGMISIWDTWPGWLYDPRGYGEKPRMKSDSYMNNPLRDIMSVEKDATRYFVAMSTAFGLLCGGKVWLITENPKEDLKNVHVNTIFIQHENPALNNKEKKREIEAPYFTGGEQVNQFLKSPRNLKDFKPGTLIPPPPRVETKRRHLVQDVEWDIYAGNYTDDNPLLRRGKYDAFGDKSIWECFSRDWIAEAYSDFSV